ncbi:hypothetical protein [Catalinimonas niigatensis]|uniref:hypothetical protein n=1 Tax=Catalinimonas niigatensis TaxID=1397264 RepID=UPI0026665BA0|nr:hypothetical protein [Catalinimonas niigatensis]WPP49841.1 hypothetical protein PZB72_24520 [Catalinimonas niigatensis]
MKNRIHINLGYYFPFIMRMLGIVFCIAGLALLLPQVLLGIPLLLLGLLIITARYRLEINLTNQTYHDHLWIAGFRKGKKAKFGSIDGLFLNKNQYSQTVNSRASSMTKYGTEYNAYIRFDVDDVHLLSNDNKAKVVSTLKKVKAKLTSDIILSTHLTINTTIKDYTEEELKEID